MSVTSAQITQVFQGILRRAPTSSELSLFSVFPDTSTIINNFLNPSGGTYASENYSAVRPIIRLFNGIFQRKPDSAGLDFWVNAYRNAALGGAGYSQATMASVCAAMFNSTEYQAAYPSTLSDTNYVTQVYTNIFHRAPDSAGLAFWVSQLGAGYSRIAMIIQFTESSEYLTDTDSGVSSFETDCANGTSGAYTGIIF